MPESDVVVVRVEPGSELDRALAEAGDRDVILVRNGASYRVRRSGEDARAPGTRDAARTRKTLERIAGTWSDIDADAWKEEVYRAREEGTRPADSTRSEFEV